MYVDRCHHLTLGGARCTYPALRDKEFCFDHEHRRVRRRHRRPPILPDTRDIAGPLVTFVDIEDYASIIENINNIAIAFAEHSIDHRQVSSLTYLMNTALKTVDRMREIQKISKEDMPQDVAYDDLDQPIALAEEPIADAGVSDHGSQLTDHPEERSNEGGVADSGSPLTDQSVERDEEAPLTLQQQRDREMHRKLNPHLFPTLNAAAATSAELPATNSRLPANRRPSNNLPKNPSQVTENQTHAL